MTDFRCDCCGRDITYLPCDVVGNAALCLPCVAELEEEAELQRQEQIADYQAEVIAGVHTGGFNAHDGPYRCTGCGCSVYQRTCGSCLEFEAGLECDEEGWSA